MAEKTAAPSGLLARILSAIVLAPLALAIVHYGTPYFEALVVIGAMILVSEWRRMTEAAEPRAPWRLVGLFYIALPCFALVWLRGDPVQGRDTIFWLFAVVWAADSGAYLFGRLIGGPKMAPAISPKKTWAGLIGGVFSAGVVGVLVAGGLLAGGWMPANPLVAAGASVALGFIAEMGDLLESWIKRRLKVKDAGALIPGHGGLFDRVDGLFAAAVAAALIGWAGKGSILQWF